jgi:hypothetical protein
MASSTWSEQDTTTAKQIWVNYQKQHDVSGLVGQTVGIDPQSGRVWIGESIGDVIAQRDADGFDSPLRFERIGSETYYRKGGRR